MTIRQLTYFLTLVKHQSFTKASKELYLSQSALSKAIKTMEFELGVDLIDRTSKKFKLSTEGRTLYENGNSAFESISSRLETLVDSVSSEKGSITIGVPPLISTIYFAPILHKFSQEFPDIKINMVEAGANTIKDQVEKGETDIGIVLLPFDTKGRDFEVYPVLEAECVAVLNKKHPLAKKEKINIGDLRNDNFIILDPTYMLNNKIREYCHLADFIPNVLSTSSQWDYITEMVALNHCISILPHLIVKKYQSKNIRLIEFETNPIPWNLALIIRGDKYKSKIIKTFIDFCQKEKPLFNSL